MLFTGLRPFDFVQNHGQVDPAIRFGKVSRGEMFMVRKCFQRTAARIRGIIVAEDDLTAPAMIVSIEIFFNGIALALDKFLKIKDRPVSEFYRAGDKCDITGFSVDGERVGGNKGIA